MEIPDLEQKLKSTVPEEKKDEKKEEKKDKDKDKKEIIII